jgi:hypothetical protein
VERAGEGGRGQGTEPGGQQAGRSTHGRQPPAAQAVPCRLRPATWQGPERAGVGCAAQRHAGEDNTQDGPAA